MIDIHTHLLPGVDDGSPTLERSITVLERFVDEGVTTVVCTPHLNASMALDAPVTAYRALLAQLQAAAPSSITIRQGWEIMLDRPGIDLTEPSLALGGSRAVLVEFTRGGLPPGASKELRRITRQGSVAVLAHPERYYGCTIDHVRQWREFGVVIQTDASVLLGRGVPAELARSFLAEGLIDILASDNHGDARSLGSVTHWLDARGATAEQCDLLLRANAELLLADEQTVPVPPLRRSFGDRVKRLFSGHS